MSKSTQYTWIGGSIAVLAVIIVIVTYAMSRHTQAYSTEQVTKRDLTEAVRTTGTIVPEDSSSLSFSSQGKIQSVSVHWGDIVHKGDILASLNIGTIKAQLDGALADQAAAEAQLSKVQSGTRPEELTISNQKYSDASAALLVAMNNAYLQTSDAINKAGALFTNGNSINPVINVRTQSQTEQTNIDNELVTLNNKMLIWKNILAPLNSSNFATTSIDSSRSAARDTLTTAQTFLSDLSTIVNNLSTGNSGLSQSAISADMAIANGASQETTGAMNAFATADAAWSNARDTTSLQYAGSQSQDIASQAAELAKAQAQVEGYQSALSQSYIIAPFDGTITNVDMKVGEVVVPGISANENIGIISTDIFNIEAYVPENAIGSMSPGDPASVTFDAYGSGISFPASVYLVSPAQTVVNGSNSYKVTLRFDAPDARIRSGLTVNALITTATATDALAVPTRGIITTDNQKFILVKDSAGTFVKKPITTGISGSDGYTQVLSGVNENDAVASFGASN